MNLIPLGQLSPTDLVSKPAIAALANQTVRKAIEEGADPVEVYTAGKAISEFGENITARTKDLAIARLSEQENYRQEVHGATASLIKYLDVLDYSEDTLWNDESQKAERVEGELAERVEEFEAGIAALRAQAKQARERVELREQQLREAAILHPLPIIKEGKQPTIRINLGK